MKRFQARNPYDNLAVPRILSDNNNILKEQEMNNHSFMVSVCNDLSFIIKFFMIEF